MDHPEARRDGGAPVAALHGEAPDAEHVVHQVRDAVGDLVRAEALLPRLERQPVAGEGGRDHGEAVRRVAAEAGRVGQARDDVDELEHRARPAMHQQQGAGVGALAGDVEEVQVDAVQVDGGLRKGVQPRFLGAPIEAVLPIGDEVARRIQVGAIGPGLARRLVGEAGAGEAFAQIVDGGVGHAQGEGLRLRDHGGRPSSPSASRARRVGGRIGLAARPAHRAPSRAVQPRQGRGAGGRAPPRPVLLALSAISGAARGAKIVVACANP